ncbi:MAG: hypothetical protein E7051_04780 [Lentisphaerae bacterium]|nr:hypothetical protein [Lentisphaerota bacterium]
MNISKILLSALSLLALNLFAVEYFNTNRWVPTRPEIVKPYKYLEKGASSITLRGIEGQPWVYFQVSPLKIAEGNKVLVKFTASGKGVMKAGFNAYTNGFNGAKEFSQKIELSSESKEYSVELGASSSYKLARPILVMMPGSEAVITAYSVEITGKSYAGTAVADRADAMYKAGENADFTVTFTCNGEPVRTGKALIEYRVDNIFKKYEYFDLAKANPFTVSVKLDQPGFFLAYGYLKDDKGRDIIKRFQLTSAGFDAEKITPAKAAPADLITYWKGEYEKLKKNTSNDVQITKWKEDARFTWYKLTCDTANGKKSYSTLRVPRGAGKYPMIFTVPPAGYTTYTLDNYKLFPPEKKWDKVIHLIISVHDKPYMSHDEYMKFQRPEYYFYQLGTTRESYYYYNAVLGVMRMMEYAMKNVKEWDGKHLAALGRSQGGGFAFIMAALNPAIQAVGADVPALCDHHARLAGRFAGWPQLLDHAKGKAFGEHAPYFDAANFASFVKVPAVVSVGFFDTMCVPASVYSAYNVLQGEKKIINYPAYGHGWGKRDSLFHLAVWELFDKTFAK